MLKSSAVLQYLRLRCYEDRLFFPGLDLIWHEEQTRVRAVIDREISTWADLLAIALARKVPAPKPGANWLMVSWKALRVFSNSHFAWPKS